MASLAQPAPRRRFGGRVRPFAGGIHPLGLVLAAVVVAAGSFAIALLGASGGDASRPAAAAPAASAARLAPPDGPAIGVDPDIARLDRAIGVWTANLQDDRADFVSAGNLALDEYTRGRLTGSLDDYDRARQATELALAVYPADTAARSMRAVLLATLHDFAAALREAGAVYDADRSQLQALATVGDAQLELGQYDAAAATYAALQARAPGAAVTARLAHLAQLQGRDADASALARRAVAEATAEGSAGPALAWYDTLDGSVAFQAGDLAAASGAFAAALTAWPTSYAALAGEARTRAAQGRFDEAIALYRRAVAIVPQPETLAALGDLYQLTGRAALARQQYDTVRAIATLGAVQRQVYDRALALFDADHGVQAAEALRLATAELAVRRDVYGWDAYAWALLANGRAAEADAAMTHALAPGTRDALLDYHAGMIAAALGDAGRARRLLSAALTLNPGFSPLQAARARTTLAALR
ncbi:MAG TPA: tetratricopeptide repeat protein [Candidatus Limnocylindrales bacterium]